MKEVFGWRWTAKISCAVLVMIFALPIHAQLMLAHEGHHDGGGCEIEGGEFPMTFSGYEVPEGNIPPMHSYCSNIPEPGKVQLTIELPDWDSREIPLAIRLVATDHEGHGGDDAQGSKVSDDDAVDANNTDHASHEGHEAKQDVNGGPNENDIIYLPYEPYKSGIIVVSADLQKGDYEILLERKDDGDDIVVAGRVPFSVGGSSGGHAGHGGGFGLMEIGLLVIIVGGAAYFYMRHKKAKEESKTT